jgi:hypothetical protein
MSNLIEQAIDCSDGDQAAKILQRALGIESDDVVNYCFPQQWPDLEAPFHRANPHGDRCPPSAVNRTVGLSGASAADPAA